MQRIFNHRGIEHTVVDDITDHRTDEGEAYLCAIRDRHLMGAWPGGSFFGLVSPRFVRRTNNYGYSSNTVFGNFIDQDQTFTQAFGKVTYAGSRLQLNYSALATPTRSTGTLLAYNGTKPNATSVSAAGNAPNADRGWQQNQVSTSGEANFFLTSSAFLSARGGYFYDNYLDTGIPTTTSYAYQTPAIGVAGVPVNLQLPAGTVIHAAIYHQFRHDNAPVLRPQLQPLLFRRRAPAQDWLRLPARRERCGVGLPGRLRVSLLGIGRLPAVCRALVPAGHLRLLRGQRLGDRRTGRGKHPLAVHPGFVERHAETDVERRPPDGRRSGAVVPGGHRCVRLPVLAEARAAARCDLRCAGRWPVQAVRELGPSLLRWTRYDLPRYSYGGNIWRIFYRSLSTLDIASLNLSNKPGRDLWNPSVPNSFRDRPRAELRLDRSPIPSHVSGQHQRWEPRTRSARRPRLALTISTTRWGGRLKTSAALSTATRCM